MVGGGGMVGRGGMIGGGETLTDKLEGWGLVSKRTVQKG